MEDSDLNDLKSMVKNPRNSTQGEFISLINSFFKKSSLNFHIPIVSNPNPIDPLDLNFTIAAIEKSRLFMDREFSSLIVEGCVVFEIWNVLEIMIRKKLVGDLNAFELMEKLTVKNRTELICLCVRKIPKLQASDIHAMLKFFLSPPDDSHDGMFRIKQEWEKEALLVIKIIRERALRRKPSVSAQNAALLLMMANDGFYSSEICLHYVFGSETVSWRVLFLAISKLDGVEVVALVRYLVKWSEKYERYPQAKPCRRAWARFRLRNCAYVPKLEAVLMGLKLVLAAHITYFVSNGELCDELRRIDGFVRSMLFDVDLCSTLGDIVKHLAEIRRRKLLQRIVQPWVIL